MNEALRGKVAASYDYGPILCSYRRRFWLEGSQWSLWIDCSPETADDLETRKDLYWEFEVRRFYLEPKVGTATEEMKMAVRWAPSSAYWSARLREFFGPEARMGIDALERQLEAATTASTNTTSGVLQLQGGAGIAGAVYTGGIINVGSTTASSSSTTGALIVGGGAGIAVGSVMFTLLLVCVPKRHTPSWSSVRAVRPRGFPQGTASCWSGQSASRTSRARRAPSRTL